jgi:hypothetical protein
MKTQRRPTLKSSKNPSPKNPSKLLEVADPVPTPFALRVLARSGSLRKHSC